MLDARTPTWGYDCGTVAAGHVLGRSARSSIEIGPCTQGVRSASTFFGSESIDQGQIMAIFRQSSRLGDIDGILETPARP